MQTLNPFCARRSSSTPQNSLALAHARRRSLASRRRQRSARARATRHQRQRSARFDLAPARHGRTRHAATTLQPLPVWTTCLEIDPPISPRCLNARRLRIAGGDNERAVSDLKAAEPLIKGRQGELLATRRRLSTRRARPDEARRVAEAAGLNQPVECIRDGSARAR